MKRNDSQLFNQQNTGITLIALIITIIILLILTGVAINMVLGENGVLNNSKEVTQNYKESQEKEELSLIFSNYYMAKAEDESLDLETYLNENNATLKEEQDKNYIIEYNRNEFTVNKDTNEIIDMQKADGITPIFTVNTKKEVGQTIVEIEVTNFNEFEDKSSINIVAKKDDNNSVVLEKNGSTTANFTVTTKGIYIIEVSAKSKFNDGEFKSKIKSKKYKISVIQIITSISVTPMTIETEESKKTRNNNCTK